MVLAVIGILTCSFCYIIYIHLMEYLNRKRFKHIKTVPIPLTFKWYLGHSAMIGKKIIEKEKKNSHADFVDIVKGLLDELQEETTVMFFPRLNIIFTVSIPIVSKVFSDHKTFLKINAKESPLCTVGGVRVFGPNGILTEAGTEVWYHKRRMMDPAFQKKYLKCLTGDMNRIAKKMNTLLGQTNCNTIDIYDVMNKVALEIVCKCGFSLDLDVVRDEPSPLNDAAQTILHVTAQSMKPLARYQFMMPWNFRAEKRKLKEAANLLRGEMRTILEKRIENNRKYPESTVNDILDHIIEGNKFSNKICIDDILDDFFVFLIAGMETTAITMSLVVWEVMKNLQIKEKLIKEVNDVYGDKTELDYEDLSKLVYLEQCIKECLRLHPPANASRRVCPKTDVVVDGILLPSGSSIILPTASIQHMEKHWPKPDQYDPDRFAPGNKIVPFTFAPFTAGPRQCIGKNFAYMEAKIVLAELYKNFHIIDPYPEERVMEKVQALTTKPRDGVFIQVEELS